jgi:uroporphyrin-III C-methyltransferase/precorrin-2 dehydrogenase/sirohydrochlorin ferrochelatase
MGVQQTAGIRKALLQAGVDADLPVALVVNGSLDTQFVLHGRIENMAQMAVQAGFDSPGLFIIGQVAALGSSLSWFGENTLLQSAA